MNVSNKQITSQQWKIFWEAVKDAGIDTQPRWEAIQYSGPTKILHRALFKKCRWYFKVLSVVFGAAEDDPYRLGKFLIAAHEDIDRLEWMARYIRHMGWSLSLEIGQWQLSRGDFVIIQRAAFRGGDKKLVIDRLLNQGVDQELIDQALNNQMDEIQGYVLSSTIEEARLIAQIVEQGANTPISPEEYITLCRQLKKAARSHL